MYLLSTHVCHKLDLSLYFTLQNDAALDGVHGCKLLRQGHLDHDRQVERRSTTPSAETGKRFEEQASGVHRRRNPREGVGQSRQHCRLTICIELVELTNSETAATTPKEGVQ